MNMAANGLELGKCYLMETGHLRRVMRIMPDGRVQYEHRSVQQTNVKIWRPGMQDHHSFASQVKREVSCDWTAESDNEEQDSLAPLL